MMNLSALANAAPPVAAAAVLEADDVPVALEDPVADAEPVEVAALPLALVVAASVKPATAAAEEISAYADELAAPVREAAARADSQTSMATFSTAGRAFGLAGKDMNVTNDGNDTHSERQRQSRSW